MFSLGRIWLVLLLYILLSSFPALGAVSTKPDKTRVLSAASRLQLPFVANRGQVKDPAVAFTAGTFACRVEVTRDGRIVYVRSQISKDGGVQMKISERIMGARIAVVGKDRQTTRISYFPGRDQSQWQSGVPGYGRVTLGHITPRIRVDLKAHGDNVEKLFHLAPGADPARIRLAVQGADEMRVSPDGDLVLTTSTGNMRLTRPVAYQEIGGERRMVAVRYTTRGNTYGFIVGAHDPSRGLIIDPLLKVFTVFEGDEIYNAFLAVTGDAAGNIYAAGYTHDQLVIYKFDQRLDNILGTVFFSSDARYHSDVIRGIALDGQGNVYVTGSTNSRDFPVTPGCYDDHREDFDYDGFIAKFSPDLVHLLAATYLGGDSKDGLYDLAIDAQNRIFVAGYSEKGNNDEHLFPVSDTAYDPNSYPVAWRKAVVARLSNDLTTVEAATYLGAQDTDTLDQWPAKKDIAYCLSLTNTGEVWVAGRTELSGFPTTPDSLDTTYNGGGDLFLAKLDADLSQLRYSTYIGGEKDEAPTDLILNSAGELFLTGWTFSADFPVTSDGYDTSYGFHEEDGFILKLAPDGNEILAGTYLGGQNDGSPNGDDVPSGLALSPDETQLAVVGRTESLTFPTTPDAVSRLLDAAIAKNNNDGTDIYFDLNLFAMRDEGTEDPDTGDGFLSILSSDLSTLLYSSFIGSKSCDYFDAVFANGKDIIIVGETQANNFPLAPHTPNDDNRALVLRFGEEDPDGPNDGDTPNSNKGSSGGGGACFIHTILP
jgi:hypothetical protein